jgi:4-amino-4-deoxy-L-arabinose transferase-like glycosyltransferase
MSEAREVREVHEVREVERGRWSFVVAIGVAAGVILPLLGAVGYFDPWETHYAEVAREMTVRDDYLYPFWKDSYFYSKPILLFWLTAPLYKLIGADDPNGPMPALAELMGRLPSAVSSLFCIAVVFFAARRLWSTRAALLSAVALATMPFWAFLSRQAITDMLYAAPAAAALLLLAVALFGEDESEGDTTTQTTPLPSWLIAGAGLCVLPQLWEIGRNGAFLEPVRLAGSEFAARLLFSVIACAVACGGLWLLWKKARDPLLHLAAVLFALSTLAKGPVGVALCGLTLLVTIAVLGEWRRLARPAALSCTALFLAIAAPWPIVMALFEGVDDQKKTWVQRFIMYDLLGRIGGGAHGDRGSFEYYARYAGFGMFPWSGLVPVALFSAAASARGTGLPLTGRSKAERFTLLVSVWCVVTFAFFAATTTKFHHYILPLCVPAALLLGRWLDRAMEKRSPIAPVVALTAVLGAALIGKDLVAEPWQFIDLFTYHYKSYKPEYYFPSDDEWRVGMGIACFGAAALMAAGALYDMVRPARDVDGAAHGLTSSAGAARTGGGPPRRLWFLTLLGDRPGAPSGFVLATVAAAILFALFAVQVHFNRASQHWSQRAIVGTYHSMKQGTEPLIAFQMDWKGETFYAKNQDVQIKKSGPDLKRACEKPGREFVLVQTDRFPGLKSALGKDFESRIRVVDRSNVKWYLVAVDP